VQGEWLMAGLMLVVCFFLGIIGQGLPHNKNKTFSQLAQGSTADSVEFQGNLDISPAETMQMGRVAMFGGLLAGIVSGVVFLITDLHCTLQSHWVSSLPLL
jgi:hypothetical protein